MNWTRNFLLLKFCSSLNLLQNLSNHGFLAQFVSKLSALLSCVHMYVFLHSLLSQFSSTGVLTSIPLSPDFFLNRKIRKDGLKRTKVIIMTVLIFRFTKLNDIRCAIMCLKSNFLSAHPTVNIYFNNIIAHSRTFLRKKNHKEIKLVRLVINGKQAKLKKNRGYWLRCLSRSHQIETAVWDTGSQIAGTAQLQWVQDKWAQT